MHLRNTKHAFIIWRSSKLTIELCIFYFQTFVSLCVALNESLLIDRANMGKDEYMITDQ